MGLELILYTEQVNLLEYPAKDANCPYIKDGFDIIIGDLHGNALKLLHMLLKHGKINNITQADYGRFVKLYEFDLQSCILDSNDLLEHFKSECLWFAESFLPKIKVKKQGVIRLIGDELADRSGNDYFTLKIIEKLSLEGSPFRINFSNHSHAFLVAHFADIENKYCDDPLGEKQSISCENLGILIQSGVESQENIHKLVQEIYIKQNLVAVDYSINADENLIIIFTHAPVGIETIKNLAEYFNKEFNKNINYKDDTVLNLAKSIDKINIAFKDIVLNNTNNIVESLFESPLLDDPHNIPATAPLIKLIWERTIEASAKEDTHNGYAIHYVHGHIGEGDSQYPHIINLDANIGRPGCMSDKYVVLAEQRC